MGYKINGVEVLSDSYGLSNIAVVPTSVHDQRRWNNGSSYQRSSASWTAGTVNLNTQNVQPTTNDFSEALLKMTCNSIASGTQSWTGNITLQFSNAGTATSRAYTMDDSAVNIGINSFVFVYIKAGGGNNSPTRPQFYLSSYQSVGTRNVESNKVSKYKRIFVNESVDLTSDDIIISWPGSTASSMSWIHEMWWR
jgi:hypothetical protein